MVKTAYVLGYLIVAGTLYALFKSYIFDNIWVDGLLTGLLVTLGSALYNKKFGKKPFSS